MIKLCWHVMMTYDKLHMDVSCMDIMEPNFSGGHHWPVQPSKAWTRLGIEQGIEQTYHDARHVTWPALDVVHCIWRICKVKHGLGSPRCCILSLKQWWYVMIRLKICKCFCRFVHRMLRLWYGMTVLRIVFLALFAGLAFCIFCAIDNCWQHLTVSLETQSKQETGMFHGAFTLGIQCRIQWGMLEWWQVCPILMLRAAPNMFADQAQSVRGTVMPHDSLGMPSWGHSRDRF